VSIGWNIGTCPNLETGSCTNMITDCNDVVDCVQCVGDAAVDQAVSLSYDAQVPATPGTALNKCQVSVGKSMSRFFAAKAQALAKCEDKVLKTGVGGPCPDAAKTLPKINRAAAKVRRHLRLRRR
jgi:hypothetical protein